MEQYLDESGRQIFNCIRRWKKSMGYKGKYNNICK